METFELISVFAKDQSGHFAYRLARCAVKCVSDCKCAGNAGKEG